MLGRPVDAEEVDLGAERQDEVVVAQRLHLVEGHLASLEVDPGDGGAVHHDVGLVPEQMAERVGDGAGVEQARGDLVQQGLERVVVVPVDQDHVGIGVLECAHGSDAGEAAAEDQHARAPRRATRFLLHGRAPLLPMKGGMESVAPDAPRGVIRRG